MIYTKKKDKKKHRNRYLPMFEMSLSFVSSFHLFDICFCADAVGKHYILCLSYQKYK